MRSYDHKEIEARWQKKWEQQQLYATPDMEEGKENAYMLVEFPYPSGNLHIGHWYAFAVPDIYVRYLRMNGKNVLYPIGFDAFGLPAENAAIKRGLDPRKWTYDNIDFMVGQLKSMGNSFDWSRKVVTCDPEYYKWTQWLFLQLYQKGLAYKKDGVVPWCDSCKTVLANEQIVSGACERCGTAVVQKDLPQWYFKITEYADKLLSDLDTLDWPEEIKQAQREWIGRSEGALLKFKVQRVKSESLAHGAGESIPPIEVFTTRPDTLYGVTYVVLAPEHALITELKDSIENWDEVSAYIEKTKAKKELERKEGKEKTGVELKGVTAINPANDEEVPVWIADYVLASYGTGAVMAVPAHDERDWEFAKKYDAPVRQVIARSLNEQSTDPTKTSVRVYGIVTDTSGKYLLQYIRNEGYYWLPGGTRESGETDEECLKREIQEESGLTNLTVRDRRLTHYYTSKEGTRVEVRVYDVDADASRQQEPTLEKAEQEQGLESVWLTYEEVDHALETSEPTRAELIRSILKNERVLTEIHPTRLIDSGPFTGMDSEEAKAKITEHAGGTMTTQYRLRDWLLSRQRYWGAPIPIVYDPEGRAHPVPDEHLPWTLPNDVDFTPTGEAPLAQSKELRERTERIFGKGWTPEIDTMDTFVCSSWYFLRYLDPHNSETFCEMEKQTAWMPVDRYSGGAEHTTMHLLYSRFFYKALYDLGLVTEREPYTTRMSRGLILGPDGQKMSKSKGNVIDPDEHVARVGADTVKMYLAFVGPYNEVGQYPWDLGGIAGVRRFLERVWNLQHKVEDTADLTSNALLLLHQTIKKVGEDIRTFKFNTAISQMMILQNALEKEQVLSVSTYESLIRMLAPFAPHLADELWESLGHETSVHMEQWPRYDESVLARSCVTIVVQVNGKVRGSFSVERGADAKSLITMARAIPRVSECMAGVEPAREVVVPDRLVNFVVEVRQ